mmetsp:Transcript_60290/g.127680  ORF Transcript_60290/g.127680 Transcript_60290/m.127680 type:complete len:145 (-) Transcript_60290:57-491(-)
MSETVEREAKNVSHQMIIWKQLIENELKTAAEWETNWGFLKGGSSKPQASAHSQSGHSLASAGRSVLGSSTGSQRMTGAARLGETAAHMDDRAKALAMTARLTPKERYHRPMTTSHEVGWRQSIEKFGVNHHGIRRNAELWPEV